MINIIYHDCTEYCELEDSIKNKLVNHYKGFKIVYDWDAGYDNRIEGSISCNTDLLLITSIQPENSGYSYLNNHLDKPCYSFYPLDHILAEIPEQKNDAVNHPSHYTQHPSGVECIQITEHMNFNCGNAFKYIWRADLKHDDGGLQDLKKAQFYLNREIERRTKTN